MSGLTAVLRHEIAERRLLLLASPLVGLLALGAPLLSAGTGASGSELRDAAALFLALVLSGLGALLLGASAIGADLASRRLAFFFSRPLSGAAVWAGKLGAAAICAWTAGLLVLLPALLVDAAAGGDGTLLHNLLLPGSVSVLVLWFAALPLAVLIAHALGVMLRTRSGWLILDLAGAVTAWAIALATVHRLQYWGALVDPLPPVPLFAIAGGAAGAALLAASAAAVIDGRTDPRRGHRTLSLTLAGLGLAGALVFSAMAQRWIAITPQDLDRWSFAAVAPGQRWIALSGPAPGPSSYGASFLLGTGSGRAVRARFAKGADRTLPLAFSADGRRAVWAERQGGQGTSPAVLVRLDLDREDAGPARTPIVETAPPDDLAISPRGNRVATVTGRQLSVYELGSGQLLAAHTVGDSLAWPAASIFLGEDRVRILISRYRALGQSTLEVYDLDLASRQLVARAALPNCSWHFLSPDAGRIACNGVAPAAVRLFDLASGRQLAELRQPGAKVRASYLADGRLAVQVAGPAGTELTLLDGDGQRRPGAPRFRLPPGAAFGWFPTPTGAFAWIVQAGADRLLAREVPAGRGREVPGLWKLLDLARGGTRSLGPQGLRLLQPFASPPATSAPLFTDGTHLVQIDLASGRRHALGPARPYHNALLDPW
jgi:hypothetical protein